MEKALPNPGHIEVTTKVVYGVEQIYPVCPKAHIFSRIAGTKTLTVADIQLIQQLGYEIIHSKPASKLDAVLKGGQL